MRISCSLKVESVVSHPFPPFLNGSLFQAPFYASPSLSPWKSPLVNKDTVWVPSTNRLLAGISRLCCCFPGFTAPGRHRQPAQLLPSAEETEQRNPRAQTVQKIFCKYFRASKFSKPVTFAWKLRRATIGMLEGTERLTVTEETRIFLQPPERFWNGEEGPSTLSNIVKGKNRGPTLAYTHSHLSDAVPEVTNLTWQIMQMTHTQHSLRPIESIWWVLFRNHPCDRRTEPN